MNGGTGVTQYELYNRELKPPLVSRVCLYSSCYWGHFFFSLRFYVYTVSLYFCSVVIQLGFLTISLGWVNRLKSSFLHFVDNPFLPVFKRYTKVFLCVYGWNFV